jgi:glycosyltransferase involved in cell wall biosynthesis
MDKQENVVNVSVVIPCRNGESTLGAQLSSLVAQQTMCSFEVIVADNGSTDNTAEVVRQFSRRDPRVRLVDASHRVGSNAARNVGVRAARADLILMCDADDVVQPGWIDALWRALHNGAQCVGGGVDYVLPDGQPGHRERKLYLSGSSPVPYALTANCGFVLDAFTSIGGFDEHFSVGADDIEFFWRTAAAGYPLTLVPEAVIDKQMRTTLKAFFWQRYSYGRGRVRLNRKFGYDLSDLVSAAARSVARTGWRACRGTLSTRDPVARHKIVAQIGWDIGILAGSARPSCLDRHRNRCPSSTEVR